MSEHVDVLIVGAGISGISAAHHVLRAFPNRSCAVLEARDSPGGTWDLFRYPGVRSDSDMHTLGYRFRPWSLPESIAPGGAILDYLKDTAARSGVTDRIRLRHKVSRAEWSSADNRWVVHAEHDGEPVVLTCDFLHLCAGYYRYDRGHRPDFPGLADFGGAVVHPQLWPDDLDCAGKRVVVIGSGATAITLVPALAPEAGHVTMLQRSPGYVASLPNDDRLARALRRVGAHGLVRWRNIALSSGLYHLSRRAPKLVKRLLLKDVARRLPANYPVREHFSPRYDPWDQRLCVAPDGDLFTAISSGRASVVTDRITRFTRTGVELESGRELPADVVVTATGLTLLPLGGIDLVVDGEPVSLPDKLVYRGTMLSDVPNLVFTVGYTNASWTLKADLVSEFLVRVLRHMAEHGHRRCAPHTDNPAMPTRPLLDFSAGYVLRSVHEFPRAGAEGPWKPVKGYLPDIVSLRHRPVADGVLAFGS
ncbi:MULTISPECIES: NAD(P)/FAD-dependent oxidoreductase [Actinosynnema]|uniref:flavin-containing monooxygenase n=1 Tax=Actinosynnema TaxID=40566 RepID=UPI0020A3FDD5|nr:NAD(P)/FAD-dependent oxidoreductase [Actinosynnema pretiosum]MCP2092355.1 putative flavoprotein CzcO associated with the cation diffusion facilitator CzcD [Actinosynnema pretiosum]